jgi:hypothetical protein
VQETLTGSKTKRRNKRSRDYLLRGDIVKCGCCGYAMSYDDSTRNTLYRCNHTLADSSAECHKLKIGAKELDDIVLTYIRKQADVVLNSGDLSELRKLSADGKQIAEYQKEVKQCIEQRQQAYERFVLQEIDQETYQSLRKDCSERLDKLNDHISIIKQAERDLQAGKKTAAIAKNAMNESVAPREIVETLIDKVLVFPGKKIKIRWKYAGFVKNERMEEKHYA